MKHFQIFLLFMLVCTNVACTIINIPQGTSGKLYCERKREGQACISVFVSHDETMQIKYEVLKKQMAIK